MNIYKAWETRQTVTHSPPTQHVGLESLFKNGNVSQHVNASYVTAHLAREGRLYAREGERK